MPHLSASQLDYLPVGGGCARQWWHRYRRTPALRSKTTPAQAMGTIFHAGVEGHLRSQMATGEFPDPVVGLAALDALFAQKGAYVALKPDDFETIHAMFSVWYAELAPRISPVAVEEEFLVPIPDRPGWSLKGFIDIRDEDNFIIDTKTASAPWEQDQADKSLQASAYGWARATITGNTPAGIAFHIVTKGGFRGGGTIVAQELVTTRSVAQLREFGDILKETVDFIGAGQFPRNFHSRYGCKGCPAYSECRAK